MADRSHDDEYGVSEVCGMALQALRLHGQAVREQGGPGFLIAFWA